MSQLQTETPMTRLYKTGKTREISLPVEPEPKPRKKPPQVASFVARSRDAFEAKLEPWVLEGKPKDSAILRVVWWLYAALRLYKISWIPQPRTVLSCNAEADRVMKRISALRHQTMAIVTVLTAKGGATKTTISTWLAATLAEATRLPFAVLDTNSGGGKAAGRFGLEKESMLTSKQLANSIDNNDKPTYRDLLTKTNTDERTGVMVIHHDAGDYIALRKTKAMVEELSRHVHTLVVDTSPNLKDLSTYGAAQVSTVRIVVGKASSDEDLEDVGETLDDPRYEMREHLDSVIIALSDLPARKCGTRTQFMYAERFKVHPNQIVLVPFDPHLKKVGRVHRPALTARARLAMSQLAELVGTTVATLNTSAAQVSTD